jgi:hypothetical protein
LISLLLVSTIWQRLRRHKPPRKGQVASVPTSVQAWPSQHLRHLLLLLLLLLLILLRFLNMLLPLLQRR